MSEYCKYSGADWLASAMHLELPPFAARVADIVGQVYRGIYHLNARDLRASTWGEDCCTVRVWGDLATFDAPHLTELVVLCHDACIRLDISPRGMHHFELMFHPRKPKGAIHERHPSIEAAIAQIRGHLLPRREVLTQ